MKLSRRRFLYLTVTTAPVMTRIARAETLSAASGQDHLRLPAGRRGRHLCSPESAAALSDRLGQQFQSSRITLAPGHDRSGRTSAKSLLTATRFFSPPRPTPGMRRFTTKLNSMGFATLPRSPRFGADPACSVVNLALPAKSVPGTDRRRQARNQARSPWRRRCRQCDFILYWQLFRSVTGADMVPCPIMAAAPQSPTCSAAKSRFTSVPSRRRSNMSGPASCGPWP